MNRPKLSYRRIALLFCATLFMGCAHLIDPSDPKQETMERSLLPAVFPAGMPFPSWSLRSEEHTSELQSLMRISYAVFCLKKKIQRIDIHTGHIVQQYKYTTPINSIETINKTLDPHTSNLR